MDSGLVRLLIVAALFLLLAGDYASLLDRLSHVFRVEAEPEAQDKPKTSSAEETTAQLALKETGSFSLNETQITMHAIKAKRRVLVFIKLEDVKVGPLKTSLGRFAKAQLLATMKNFCLPKLICELNAMPQKDKLSDSEKALLSLISDTTISTTAEVTSKYHFAAHMGQLISGVDGAGCHNFYPSCPFPGVQVLNMIKNIRLRPPS